MHCKGGCGKLRGEDGAFDPPDDAFGTQAWPDDDLFCYRCGRAEKLQQEAVEKADAEGDNSCRCEFQSQNRGQMLPCVVGTNALFVHCH